MKSLEFILPFFCSELFQTSKRKSLTKGGERERERECYLYKNYFSGSYDFLFGLTASLTEILLILIKCGLFVLSSLYEIHA